MARILILDDDVLFLDMLSSAMLMEGHEVCGVSTIAQCREALAQGGYDLVFLDVGLPDGDGLSLIPYIRQDILAPEIIIITGDCDADGAELAITGGALDYITKPASLTAMKQAVHRALAFRNGRGGLEEPEREGIVGSSPGMQRCFRVLAEAASSDAPVLITGETGTGKELFARAIHRNSARAGKPFVAVDCGSIAKSLTESELFGHEKGAFTGADRPREGLILQADGGTLFLDEVSELAVPQQRTFLRVLQERRFRPVGSGREVASNFRLVAATNRLLPQMVERGSFRKDLLYRLQAITLMLPPLRERLEDIPELAAYFVARGCARYRVGPKSLNEVFLRELAEYPWPGNVREFMHVVEQSLVRARFSDQLLPEHLPSVVRVAAARRRIGSGAEGAVGAVGAAGAVRQMGWGMVSQAAERREQESAWWEKAGGADGGDGALLSVPVGVVNEKSGTDGERVTSCQEAGLPVWREFRDAALESAERAYLERLLSQAQGNVARASDIAGVTRQWLYAMLRKHGIARRWDTGRGE
ncbi:sigma-54-dependent transcriptional regulator [Desulfovibrio psychrotolerans]|uniref:Fis family transcriptional regulator n=1 Tax=Desulfovibrio psychrotolerans TaxID=415242 RepID=A0A7J0BTG8_9BACT|nr:sigma-54 dependent transcriptional regulator [Desulfovibrio psychrotolerans]GFM37013.1 Fis family transcriptional regulator [Desulfovibrio psychrotolerans]